MKLEKGLLLEVGRNDCHNNVQNKKLCEQATILLNHTFTCSEKFSGFCGQ